MKQTAGNIVVITRPLTQALPLAARVSAIGRDAVVFPLLDIQPLPEQEPLKRAMACLGRYAMVAFVSPNAIDAAFSVLDKWPPQVAIAVMGEGSRAALQRHGVTDMTSMIVSPRNAQRTDSQTLLEELDLDALRDKEVLIVRGETGRELLADALRAAGVKVAAVAAYRRVAPAFDQERRARLTRLLETRNDWIVTSSEALRFLAEMAERLNESAALRRQRLIIPHERIAETATALGFDHIILTGSGDEQLLAALQSTE
ncbi:MAG: uroporphyrinogen synthase [Noviherbaspirillum sp.]|jgi:uroporphyrinogen-III synthase|nr:uroporphyrinogen synthase [Noviherbaspirillum sp.]MDB5795152.1 uroporphyrinogen synthase [Noviherbaspirillum sp.]